MTGSERFCPECGYMVGNCPTACSHHQVAGGPVREHGEEAASFTARANAIRKRVPFAYWLVYDAVTAPLLVWGAVALSPWFWIGLVMLAFAAFFDVNEAFVKWAYRG